MPDAGRSGLPALPPQAGRCTGHQRRCESRGTLSTLRKGGLPGQKRLFPLPGRFRSRSTSSGGGEIPIGGSAALKDGSDSGKRCAARTSIQCIRIGRCVPLPPWIGLPERHRAGIAPRKALGTGRLWFTCLLWKLACVPGQ
jgi:hypothetical protein